MSDTINLGGQGSAEFEAIRALMTRWGERAVGIGDDAALLEFPRGDTLVASVDTAIEGRHFRRGVQSPREIGYRAVTAALSDLAAMAARPLGVLVALAVPETWRADLLEIADGIGDAVDAAKTTIRGGNLADASELSITTTVLGSVFHPLSRGGARVGDLVYVTGVFGDAPVARIAEARWLAARGATSAIDISDGLAADLSHVAAASSCRIEIDVTRIGRDALASGEEYELVVTGQFDTEEFRRAFGIPLTEIGRVAQGAADVVLLENGKRVAPPKGYDHFSG